MFSMLTRTHVAGLSGREITDFLSTRDDEAFRGWWPGTRFIFIPSREPRVRGPVGNSLCAPVARSDSFSWEVDLLIARCVITSGTALVETPRSGKKCDETD
jgi:hypothetical protein